MWPFFSFPLPHIHTLRHTCVPWQIACDVPLWTWHERAHSLSPGLIRQCSLLLGRSPCWIWILLPIKENLMRSDGFISVSVCSRQVAETQSVQFIMFSWAPRPTGLHDSTSKCPKKQKGKGVTIGWLEFWNRPITKLDYITSISHSGYVCERMHPCEIHNSDIRYLL